MRASKRRSSGWGEEECGADGGKGFSVDAAAASDATAAVSCAAGSGGDPTKWRPSQGRNDPGCKVC